MVKYKEDFVRTMCNINGIKMVGKYINVNTETEFLCQCGNMFISKPIYIYRQETKSCGKCFNRILKNEYPDLFQELDNDLNCNIDIDNITYGSNVKYWWKCKTCGRVFYESVKQRTARKIGCGKCHTIANNKELLKQWDFNKNKYDVKNIKISSHKKYWWICTKCGKSYLRSVYNMKYAVSCGKCNLMVEKFPHLVKEWDYEKNKDVDINSITSGMDKKFWWKCLECGNSWNAVVYNRTKLKCGCPLCRASKGEIKIKDFLEKYKIKYEQEKVFGKCKNIFVLRFDFYLPCQNLCIEYQGEQHYRSVGFSKTKYSDINKQKKRDSVKKEFCLNNNILLLEIPYWNYDYIDCILQGVVNG